MMKQKGEVVMVSKIVSNITPSATCELEGTIADLRHQGLDIIGLQENQIY